MKLKRKKKLNERPFFVKDEVEELKAEIARLRGEPERKKEQEKRRLVGKSSPCS